MQDGTTERFNKAAGDPQRHSRYVYFYFGMTKTSAGALGPVAMCALFSAVAVLGDWMLFIFSGI